MPTLEPKNPLLIPQEIHLLHIPFQYSSLFTTAIQFDYNTIAGLIRELAFLNPNLMITLRQEDTDPEKNHHNEYFYAWGLVEYVRWLNTDNKLLHDVVGFRKEMDGITIDVALHAEATLRRVHAAQKDDEMPPIEAIIAPLEAELKLARQEVAKLQDDNRAIDRLTKSKEAALVEAERTVQIAMVKASLVDDLQNKNQELMKQIEICQEENKILDKMHRQKVAEVEMLTQTVRELEEAVLAGGAAANAVRDYQRKC
ncbi:hypothetical protein L3X38_037310 [Prunus dulcis]|uniref:Uncharacterized protein n=1 Tax=Prunus dulcis TaxID=3755 RepID=A0AAD4YR59_PRUDU|nr:hypothetical protein L3X38_037310 [Prunus dulcis]